MEIAKKYGAEAVVSCISEPPVPLRSYVLTCWEHQWLGELLSRALGMAPATGGITVSIRQAKLLIIHPRRRIA